MTGYLNERYGNFNSIKVRLERPYRRRRSLRYNIFQFHKGAIRTCKNIAEDLQIEISIP